MNLNPQFYNAKAIRNKISSAKNEMMSVSEFSHVEFDKDIVRIFEKYNSILKTNNSVDFDDLLVLPIQLLNNSEVLDRYQELYKYILIETYKLSLFKDNYTDSEFLIKTSNKQTINYKKYRNKVNKKIENTTGVTKYKYQNKKRY